ncbi:MAG: WYL domain-containing protein [Bacteroidetes bacterium]|nr:WYL domain-containing protein [Bacteroidota bacterium]
MPANRNALLRYMTIDNCLKNRYRKWTLEDLIDACSDALYEYEGIDKGVSRRTVQMDIQMMRSEKLGYNAPIIISEKKYYSYDDPEYSITNIPLTDQDLNKLTEAVNLIKQFKGFAHFEDLGGIVQRLEDKVQVSRTKGRPIIDMESNENLRGLHWMEILYKAIQIRKKIAITYQSFKAREPQIIIFHPGLLKEYQNRWFVLGHRNGDTIYQLLALDRMQKIDLLEEDAVLESEEFFQNYFKQVIGVTVNHQGDAEIVRFFATMESAPYLLTKPLHASQKLIEKNHFGMIFEIEVQLNFELEKVLLGLGETVRVIAPSRLKKRMFDRIEGNLNHYKMEMNQEVIQKLPGLLGKKGFHVLENVYSDRECRHLRNLSKRLISENPELSPQRLAELCKDYWHKEALDKVLRALGMEPESAKAFHNLRYSAPEEKKKWSQGTHSNWIIRIQLKEERNPQAHLKIIKGIHHRKLEPDEIDLLLQQGADISVGVPKGGIMLLHPDTPVFGDLSGAHSPGNTFQLMFSCQTR